MQAPLEFILRLSFLFLYHQLQSLTGEGGRGNWSTQRNTLMMISKRCNTLQPGNSAPDQDSNLHSSTGDRHLLAKQMC